MDLKKLLLHQDRENYFVNISAKASENCIKEFDSKVLSDEEKECLQKSALGLHHIINNSRLERWAAQPEKRPYEYYYWMHSKQV